MKVTIDPKSIDQYGKKYEIKASMGSPVTKYFKHIYHISKDSDLKIINTSLPCDEIVYWNTLTKDCSDKLLDSLMKFKSLQNLTVDAHIDNLEFLANLIACSKSSLTKLKLDLRPCNDAYFYSDNIKILLDVLNTCLLYTSPSPRDRQKSRMPSSA
eukprot:TRINITY_DN11076_c0_g1_i1.p1 TRINITY_DN11076_c0_g1~~TRINITY_DN11076_c0_g1_i1.p1  ORF type:complete len:156 (+),score=17.56 TRINITY_DN11076_c0_g1_i1:165-632(+)